DEALPEDIGRCVVALADQAVRVDDDDAGRQSVEQQLEPGGEPASVALLALLRSSCFLELGGQRADTPLEGAIGILELLGQPVERKEGLLQPTLVDVHA